MHKSEVALPDLPSLLKLYRKMVEIRKCEESLIKAFNSGLMYGGCHTYIGQEAIASGVSAHLNDDDFVFGTHRGHGHALAKGLNPFELFAELYGRSEGASGGRGGSMHLFKPSIGLMGTNGIVGPSLLLATGAAYTFKMLKTARVAVAYFGDGGVNNGAFHEGCNMAANWDLPVIFVCENNLYATEIPFASVTKQTSVAKRGESYGLHSVVADGTNILDVYAKAGEAVKRAREGHGPTLLECLTYRHRSHSEGMRESGYRTKEEVQLWKERDPIKALAAHLQEVGLATDSELLALAKEVGLLVDESNKRALESPEPDAATQFEHVLAASSGSLHA